MYFFCVVLLFCFLKKKVINIWSVVKKLNKIIYGVEKLNVTRYNTINYFNIFLNFCTTRFFFYNVNTPISLFNHTHSFFVVFFYVHGITFQHVTFHVEFYPLLNRIKMYFPKHCSIYSYLRFATQCVF